MGMYDDELAEKVTDFTDLNTMGPMLMPTRQEDSLVLFYRTRVVGLQYLLADKGLHQLVSSPTQSDNYVFNAVCLLSSIYRQYLNGERNTGDLSIADRYALITPMLSSTVYTPDHAIAALHTVSSFLFAGGTGEWYNWLQVAYTFADHRLRGPYISPTQALLQCDEKMRFILKTAMWFDVISSVTLFQPPHFLPEFRKLFNPSTAYIESPSSSLDPRMSMMKIMGCENRVVWAMAEVSYLACWKESMQRKGRLSIPELVSRGKDIERSLLPSIGPEELYYEEDINWQRRRTSEVFRSSTRVYLHSVISGDHPHCPEIAESVKDTISCLKAVPEVMVGGGAAGNNTRSVVRSVVLSIFICGCLTDDVEQRRYLLRRLNEQAMETVGNCSAVKTLMEQVWNDRANSKIEEPVRWRESLKRSGLLLV
jgi:hypothetical protein